MIRDFEITTCRSRIFMVHFRIAQSLVHVVIVKYRLINIRDQLKASHGGSSNRSFEIVWHKITIISIANYSVIISGNSIHE